MTQLRKGSFIKRAKDISISSALAIALLSSAITLPGCSSNDEEESSYTYEEPTYSKGIRSHITEVRPGEFKIMDEESVANDKSVAIVTYLDGHKDSLSTSAAKALIDDEIRTNPNYHTHHSGLSSMLLWGGMGYLLGRNSNNGYINNYRDRNPNPSGYYGSAAAFNKAQNATQEVNASRSARVVRSRPASGKKGFFSRSFGRSGG